MLVYNHIQPHVTLMHMHAVNISCIIFVPWPNIIMMVVSTTDNLGPHSHHLENGSFGVNDKAKLIP